MLTTNQIQGGGGHLRYEMKYDVLDLKINRLLVKLLNTFCLDIVSDTESPDLIADFRVLSIDTYIRFVSFAEHRSYNDTNLFIFLSKYL